MARVSRRLGQQLQIIERQQATSPQTNLRSFNERGLRIVKLDDHLPAPVFDFEDPDFEPTTVYAKNMRRTGQLVEDHYEIDDREDDDGNGMILVVNRFPWVWEYKHAYIMVERFQGEWVPRQPLYSIMLGKTAAEIDKDTTGTIDIYWHADGTKGSESVVTGESVEAYNRYVDAADDAWVTVQWHNQGWEFRTLECFE